MANKFYIPFELHNEVYSPTQVIEVLDRAINPHMRYGNNKKVYYYNVPCAFDIETTSFYEDAEGYIDYATLQKIRETNPYYKPNKVAIMYVWQFGINGYVIIGRTWEEFVTMMHTISDYLRLHSKNRLLVYVHNLAFEFQFMRKWFKWENVFSMSERKPIYALTDLGIEFRCSYLLSGYSLKSLAEQLRSYKVKKLVGDLDYQLLRHTQTPLTDNEIAYCVNDVLIVMAYIQECIDTEQSVSRIPLTKTGYVRRYCKQNTLRVPNTHKQNRKYKELIESLRIETVEEFDLIHEAFMGGFTHANAAYSGLLMHDVASYDFTSSYPYVLLAEKFPMSKGIKKHITTLAQFEEYINKYCCVFRVMFKGLKPRLGHENYISYSKCINNKTKELREEADFILNNGRVVYANTVMTTITNVDYQIIKKFYKWDSIAIQDFYIYHRQYLPTALVKCILKLYGDKTTLKGVQDKEAEYMQGKAMLNSIYGMCVTNPIRDEILIDELGENWSTELAQCDLRQELLTKHNDSKSRFIYYLWGVFCTAYARYNLFTAIENIGDDYLYSDTDSVKIKNAQAHQSYFEAYNKLVEKKLKSSAAYHQLDYSLFAPKTIKGESKLIGVWDYEGTYKSFKTLGAKRYAIEEYNKDNEPRGLKVNGKWYPVSITVSGVNKYTAVPYLYDTLSNGDVNQFMANFDENLHVPSEYTGKLLHTYIDEPMEGCLVDYTGTKANFRELSAVHLEPTSYDLSIASQYINYIMGIRDEEKRSTR